MSEIILSIDPADEGKDLSVLCFSRIEGGVLNIFKWIADANLNEIKAAQSALFHIKEMGITPSNVIVDAVGVGAGCLNTLVSQGVYAYRFIGSAKPDCALPFYQFKNKRAEAAWLLRESFRNRTIKLSEHNERLKNEILASTYFIDNEKYIALTPKAEIKRKLGHSPDYFDALCMANYLFCKNGTSSITALTARPKRISGIVKGY